MKPAHYLLTALLASVLFLSCRKDREGVNNFSCDGVARALTNGNVQNLRDILEPMMSSFEAVTSEDQAQAQLMAVVEFLDECPNLEASLLCFECIHSLPPQSEISVKITTGVTSVIKIIDISRDNTGKFRVVAIHE